MSITEIAEKEGFALLTESCHPTDNQIVTILGVDFNGYPRKETVKWSMKNGQHSYKWITHDFNRAL